MKSKVPNLKSNKITAEFVGRANVKIRTNPTTVGRYYKSRINLIIRDKVTNMNNNLVYRTVVALDDFILNSRVSLDFQPAKNERKKNFYADVKWSEVNMKHASILMQGILSKYTRNESNATNETSSAISSENINCCK